MTIDPRTVIRDKVAEAIRHMLAIHPWGRDLPYPFSEYVERLKLEIADAAIAAHLEALDEANTIRTVEQLDALQPSSVILTAFGSAAQRAGGPGASEQDTPASAVNDSPRALRSA